MNSLGYKLNQSHGTRINLGKSRERALLVIHNEKNSKEKGFKNE